MQKKLPSYIVAQYRGGVRGFKTEKRQTIRAIEKHLSILRFACSWLPTGSYHVDKIQREIAALKTELSQKNWGR